MGYHLILKNKDNSIESHYAEKIEDFVIRQFKFKVQQFRKIDIVDNQRG